MDGISIVGKMPNIIEHKDEYPSHEIVTFYVQRKGITFLADAPPNVCIL